MRKYIHWLKFDFMDKESLRLLEEYANKKECTMTRFVNINNFIHEYIKLECTENYSELDLYCNSLSSNIIRLNSKPSNIKECKRTIQEIFKQINERGKQYG